MKIEQASGEALERFDMEALGGLMASIPAQDGCTLLMLMPEPN